MPQIQCKDYFQGIDALVLRIDTAMKNQNQQQTRFLDNLKASVLSSFSPLQKCSAERMHKNLVKIAHVAREKKDEDLPKTLERPVSSGSLSFIRAVVFVCKKHALPDAIWHDIQLVQSIGLIPESTRYCINLGECRAKKVDTLGDVFGLVYGPKCGPQELLKAHPECNFTIRCG
ncbi:MAG: hypothetical protein AB7E52_09035 [Bdellovibrionales bacterium]